MKGTDDGVTIVLRYACGGSATLVYQSKVDTSCTAEIFGTKGSFKVESKLMITRTKATMTTTNKQQQQKQQ